MEREAKFQRADTVSIEIKGPNFRDEREPFNLPRNQEARTMYESAKASVTSYDIEHIDVPRDEPIWMLLVSKQGCLCSRAGDEGLRTEAESQTVPVLLADYNGKLWWLFQGAVYSTKEELEPDEVLALIGEQENKKKLKIARAKTVAAMADQLDRKGSREPIPQDVKVAVWQRDGGSCVQCGAASELEFDHIIPLAMGGSNTFRNLQLLCGSCNREKGASL